MSKTTFQQVEVERVRDFWDSRPCNIRHSPKEVGTREYFDDVETRKYFVEPHIPLFAEFERWRGKRVLEIGCGIGTDTIGFARHGAFVTAVELSKNSMEIAQKRARVYGFENQIQFVNGNAERLTEFLSPQTYDLVYSFGVIHHTPNPENVLQQIRQYMNTNSLLRIMVYHRFSWKVFAILLSYGKGMFWNADEIIARYSEAQSGCPVTYTYSSKSAAQMLERHGFQVKEIHIDHIFPYRIPDYVQHRYVKVWPIRWMPRPLFRSLEHKLGWHLCLSASLG